MKVLCINGSPHEKGCTYTALSEVCCELAACSVDADILSIGQAPIAGCTACGACRKTGRCRFDDVVNRTAPLCAGYDAFIIGSPVYYGGPSGQLKAFLDRLFYTASASMAGKFGACVVSCRRGGASSAFEVLNKYFTINNMHVVSSQYWNMVHGSCPAEVLRDAEGMQTMRTLARNLAWLLHCVEAGRAAGIEPPVWEPKVRTNFIEPEKTV